jgi:hypothetical protein
MGSGDDTEVTIHKFNTTNLEAFLHNLGSKLVDAVIVGILENVVDDTTLVRRGTMLAQVLDTPVAELTVSDEVDACNDFLNGGALQGEFCQRYSTVIDEDLPFLPQHSSQRCSAPPSYQSLQVQLHATYHAELR